MEVSRLHRDIQTLAVRLRVGAPDRFEAPHWEAEFARMFIERVPKTAAQSMVILMAMGDQIRGAEQHLGAIRAMLDDLLSDAGEKKHWRAWQGERDRG